ncbi:MAG: HAMP domain-containing protein, partial [Pirellulaceae bacterium]|nr:HAMP domain-containing protein [Pirellulaceae bacterium]
AVLEHQPMVTAACIYVEDGTVFATYTKAAVPQSFPEIEELSHRFVGDHVEIFSAIRSDDQRVGTIYIRRELTDVDEHVYRVIGLAVAVLLASLAITMLIAARFQRHLTRPIEQLSQTIEAVGAGDLEAKVSITRRDEIGQLAETFNKMTDRLKQTTVSRDDLAHLNEELAQFNRMAVGRENRMIELKREVNSLAEAAGQSPPYDLSFTEEPAQVGGDGHDG